MFPTAHGVVSQGGNVVPPEPGDSYRYYRLTVTAMTSAGNAALGWLQLRTGIGGPNVATDPSKASAQDEIAGWEAGKAFGVSVPVNQNWFAAGAPPRWIQYDFGAGNEVVIVEYAVRGRASNMSPYPAAWTLHASNDGTTWDLLDSVSGQTWANDGVRVFPL